MGRKPERITMNAVRPESVGLSSARLQRLDAVMHRHIECSQIAGALTVIMRRGQIAQVGLYGKSDNSTGKPVQEDTIFRIFSMTKPITSLAILMLYEEGLLHLMSPIGMFMPVFNDLKVQSGDELVEVERPITIHDLLTHTSGLGYGVDVSTPVNSDMQKVYMMRMDESMADKLIRLAQFPLQHQPGACYSYSIATDVLGHLVELISGMPLDEFFKKRIFEPLGMVDTDFFVPTEKLPRLATLYTPAENGQLVDVASLNGDPLQLPFGAWTDKSNKPDFLSGGAGLVSTAADYLHFAMLLRNKGELDGERLVSRKTIELMTLPHLPEERFIVPGFGCGLGVVIMTDPARAQMLGSVGAFGGGGAANTEYWVDPSEDMIGLLMTQHISYSPCPVPLDFKTLAMQAIMD
jgi:CubicO group peptidase (beta-lactamase class C family)